MIYTDGIHLITDGDIEELHTFANKIGLKRKHFQCPRAWQAHYDVWGKPREKALKMAVNIDSYKLVSILKRRFEGGLKGS